jgi:inorganic pyrophosphatase
MNPEFWIFLDRLVTDRRIVIDRPKGSVHPRYPDLVYPLDYGYLEDTRAGDGAGIDVWVGTDPARTVVGILCTIDLYKRDAELKLLLGCSCAEIETILAHTNTDLMQAELILRPNTINE